MPQRRPKFSIVLGAVAAAAVASPFAVYSISSTPVDVRSAHSPSPADTSLQIAEVVLAASPDILLPFEELTGLDLTELLRFGLQNLPIPAEKPLPALPSGPGITPSDIAAGATGGALPTPGSPPPQDQTGVTVKELSRDTPFRMVALTSNGRPTPAAEVRAKQPDGSWGPWFSTTQIDTPRKDGSTTPGKQGTEPIYVGKTTTVQVLVPSDPTSVSPVPPTNGGTDAPTPSAEAPITPPPLGYAPASVVKPLAQAHQSSDVTAVLIEPGETPVDNESGDATNLTGPSGPKVISRAQWGADESLRCEEPVYDDFLAGAVVHHTAGSNDYSKEESADIIRGIYAYHAQTLGWCDIGYHVLVDKYGQIFEGRAGGLDKPVQGAHTGGFNENTMGIAMMGDYTNVEPTPEEINSVGQFLGWRLEKAGLDPQGTTTMYSEGTDYTSFPEGAAVDIPVISAHRDLGNTTDPGDMGYAHMDEIRDIAAAYDAAGNESAIQAAAPTGTQPAQTESSPHPNTDPHSATSPTDSRLPALASELVRLTDQSPLARKWQSEGGETGRLGRARSGELTTQNGNRYADFANGAIYTSSNGEAWAVLGTIYNAWTSLSAAAGELGLPTSDEYRIPEGLRTDFENGSLVFNEITGIVTKILAVSGSSLASEAAPEAPPAP
ncbi:N-acetylmuramoyl-L-alanine amidase [Rhodococcus opacus]|uniref:N-acetylmuramoyl-L-alanine amidase n=1 Tax=Rhodococcus opacus TaxID=37919 RepID=UPI0029C37309|nr:N-acetylmuramoyl-L-alanine amidase [Rhodococcus opacus]MDX5961903.1 N-acetylmuramoyl-L-alanine amidase [Rhodococcus opacus]